MLQRERNKMNNTLLMDKVKELDFQTLHTREQSLKVMTQISVIRKAFGVKNDESNTVATSYERDRVMTNQDIKKDFSDYGRWITLNRKHGLEERNHEDNYYNRARYHIEAVEFFDKDLASELKESFKPFELK